MGDPNACTIPKLVKLTIVKQRVDYRAIECLKTIIQTNTSFCGIFTSLEGWPDDAFYFNGAWHWDKADCQVQEFFISALFEFGIGKWSLDRLPIVWDLLKCCLRKGMLLYDAPRCFIEHLKCDNAVMIHYTTKVIKFCSMAGMPFSNIATSFARNFENKHAVWNALGEEIGDLDIDCFRTMFRKMFRSKEMRKRIVNFVTRYEWLRSGIGQSRYVFELVDRREVSVLKGIWAQWMGN